MGYRHISNYVKDTLIEHVFDTIKNVYFPHLCVFTPFIYNVSDRDVGPDTISDTFRARTLHHPCALKMEQKHQNSSDCYKT